MTSIASFPARVKGAPVDPSVMRVEMVVASSGSAHVAARLCHLAETGWHRTGTELSTGQRNAVTKVIATRYARASKRGKGTIWDELCATTGWHRNHTRKALSVTFEK